MTVNEYQQRAMATLNPGLSEKDVLINSVMGLCGESGEAIDIVKKWLAQGHPLDREHLASELGDVAWYLAEAATALGLPLEDILRANLEKLERRYPDGFSTEKSVGREKSDI
jgi:NTP pyrophosphatase (non-canonical NTP hydrolase)